MPPFQRYYPDEVELFTLCENAAHALDCGAGEIPQAVIDSMAVLAKASEQDREPKGEADEHLLAKIMDEARIGVGGKGRSERWLKTLMRRSSGQLPPASTVLKLVCYGRSTYAKYPEKLGQRQAWTTLISPPLVDHAARVLAWMADQGLRTISRKPYLASREPQGTKFDIVKEELEIQAKEYKSLMLSVEMSSRAILADTLGIHDGVTEGTASEVLTFHYGRKQADLLMPLCLSNDLDRALLQALERDRHNIETVLLHLHGQFPELVGTQAEECARASLLRFRNDWLK